MNKTIIEYIEQVESEDVEIHPGDGFYFDLNDRDAIETDILMISEDSILVELDQMGIALLEDTGIRFEEILDESTFPFAGLGKHKIGRASQLRSPGPTGYPKGKLVGGAAEDIEHEAQYQGHNVPVGKPMKGDVKKSKVYVRKPNGKIVKVNFGDKTMRIKKSIPSRRKNFRARHNCANPGPRWKARYWSCRAW
ncbi:hypothetical protein EBU71_15785 [bacterium]|nr:hypothetical protein [Candidatus Elulimicrobium humile]